MYIEDNGKSRVGTRSIAITRHRAISYDNVGYLRSKIAAVAASPRSL